MRKGSRCRRAWSRNGRDPLERFFDFVCVCEDGCWRWTGFVLRRTQRRLPYGRFAIASNVHAQAHRFAYARLVGPIPDGLEVDHLCFTPSCVNPDHLELVTQSVNIRRANALRPNRTHCRRGHKWVDPYIFPSGARSCRVCRAIGRERYRMKQAH